MCRLWPTKRRKTTKYTIELWLRSEQRRYGNDGTNKFSHKVPEDNWRMAISSVETPLVSMLPKRLYLIIFPLHTHSINGSEIPLVAHVDVYMTSAISKTLRCFPFVFFFSSRNLPFCTDWNSCLNALLCSHRWNGVRSSLLCNRKISFNANKGNWNVSFGFGLVYLLFCKLSHNRAHLAHVLYLTLSLSLSLDWSIIIIISFVRFVGLWCMRMRLWRQTSHS